jgi:hypothetical protein
MLPTTPKDLPQVVWFSLQCIVGLEFQKKSSRSWAKNEEERSPASVRMADSFVMSASSFAYDRVPQREAQGKKEDPKSWWFVVLFG